VPGTSPGPKQVLALALAVGGMYILGGGILPALLGEGGILLTQIVFLLLPALAFLRAAGGGVSPLLPGARPSRRQLVGATLLIAGGMPLAWGLAWMQSLVLPLPEGYIEAMGRMMQVDSPGRLAWLLLLVAITPAVCEEILFRGVVMKGLRSLGAPAAIGISSVIFASFHLSLESAFRFLPTLWLGALLGVGVWLSGSVWIGVLMHGLNNGSIVLLGALAARVAGDASPADPQGAPPLFLLPVALFLVARGVRLLSPPVQGPGGLSWTPTTPP